MLTKRIIACLDVKDGHTVKGTQFVNLRLAGDPVELARQHAAGGVDELVFLDISASKERRGTLLPLVRRVAAALPIPFTVGGGIGSLADAEQLLQNGADKISVNSAAVRNPDLIDTLAKQFGSQCVVVAIDATPKERGWQVRVLGGSEPTDRELFEWAAEAEQRGAGEILFTSTVHDGTRQGFAVEALAEMNRHVRLPVIASGGAGEIDHFAKVFKAGADAALAASVFHFNQISIRELKTALVQQGIHVRPADEH